MALTNVVKDGIALAHSSEDLHADRELVFGAMAEVGYRLLHGCRDQQVHLASLILEEAWVFVQEKGAEIDFAMTNDQDFTYDYFGVRQWRSRTSHT